MAFADKIRHLFRPQEPAPARMTESEAELWIAERKARLDRLSPDEIDQITRDAFANVDKDAFLKESAALHEQRERKTARRAARKAQ